MTEIERKYTQDDLTDIALKLSAARDYMDLLEYSCDRKTGGPSPATVALTMRMFIEPVADFIEWAMTYATLPSDEDTADQQGEK
jgi:hypothetical protein